MIANTPPPPYYAVIFTSVRSDADMDYHSITERMLQLAHQQEGFLGVESAREEIGITVSYWRDLESIKKWKENAQHMVAQEMGKKYFYTTYKTRICRVEKDYIFDKK